MKTSQDPRHQKRIDLMQKLFAYSFGNTPDSDISVIVEHIERIDQLISESAPEWPINKISKTDLAILRLAVHELLFSTDTPQKVVIDEAIELAKAYSNDASASFINGALGAYMKRL